MMAFIQENAIRYVVCKMPAILFGAHCVDQICSIGHWHEVNLLSGNQQLSLTVVFFYAYMEM